MGVVPDQLSPIKPLGDPCSRRAKPTVHRHSSLAQPPVKAFIRPARNLRAGNCSSLSSIRRDRRLYWDARSADSAKFLI